MQCVADLDLNKAATLKNHIYETIEGQHENIGYLVILRYFEFF